MEEENLVITEVVVPEVTVQSTETKDAIMSDFVAGNSVIKDSRSDLLDAVHTNAILDAVNANGINNNQTTQEVGLAADATAQRGFNHVDGTAQRMAIAELDAIGRVGDEVCDSSRDIMRDIHGMDNHVSASVERHGLYNAGVTERNADKTQAEVERFGLFNNAAIERNGDKTQGVVQSESHRTQSEVEKFGFRELDAIHGAEKYLYAGMSQNAKEMLVEFERTKLRMDSNTKDILMQNCHDTASIKMQAEVHAKDAALAARDLMHQADKNTAAIQLEAFRHKEELARQIAECCCEQKALTLETSHKTQDVVREVEDRRVRDELARTREELIALRVRASLLPPLTGSVPL